MISYRKIVPVSELKNLITAGDINKINIRRDKNDTLNDESLISCRFFIRETKRGQYMNTIEASITKVIKTADITLKEKQILGGIYSELRHNRCIKESTLDKLLDFEDKYKDVHFAIPNKYKTKFWRT